MSILRAHYFDGRTSAKHEVSLLLAGGAIKVVGREVEAEFDSRKVRRSLRIADTPRWLYLPGGGACVTEDNEAVDRWTRENRYERLLRRWEGSPQYAAFAVLVIALALWLFFDKGLPAAAQAIAMRIPVASETVMGQQALLGLERSVLQPSKLPPARLRVLHAKFNAMARAAGHAGRYRLEFRASPALGANAFALPAGVVVATDELVRLARRDEEILTVLAHELGHVHHRHTMRRLLETSATGLIVAALTGDIASGTALMAAAPALLLQMKYSRENEAEADRFAIGMLKQAKIDPRHFAAILGRLERRAKGLGRPAFLSSHPATEERQAMAGGVDAQDEAELVPDKPKLHPADPEQREVLALLERRDFEALERLIGERQAAYEQDEVGSAKPLENAYDAFWKLPRSAQKTLDDWVRASPDGYAAAVGRATFYMNQGFDARGGDYANETPEQNMDSMRHFLTLAEADLTRSLALHPKPYISRRSLMTIAYAGGNGAKEMIHYREGLKFAPQTLGLRLTHMRSLEPRWGGSLPKMEAFLAESRAALRDPAAVARLAARIPAYRGFERERANDYAGAVRHYGESLAMAETADILCQRSHALERLGRDGEAYADAKRGLALAREDNYCLKRAVFASRHAPNDAEAFALLRQVIEVDRSSSAALVMRAERYAASGDPERSFADMLAAANLGETAAQIEVGKRYLDGIGVKADREQAFAWLKKADASGDLNARPALIRALEKAEKR